MAAVNGHAEEQQRPSTPTAHLGKRKRGHSPSVSRSGSKRLSNNALKQSIDRVVNELRSHDLVSNLLQQPSQHHSASPQHKRRRTEESKQTIENAVASNLYGTLDDFLGDLSHATRLLRDRTGEDENTQAVDAQQITSAVDRIVSKYSNHSDQNIEKGKEEEEKEEEAKTAVRKPIEVLSLRGSLEGGGVKQLYTGLRQIPADAVKAEEIEAKNLPNGFEVVEASTLSSSPRLSKDRRTFGEVFTSRRNVKQIEMPRSSRGTRSNTLDFVQPFAETTSANKQDYKHSSLNSGSWVTYGSLSAGPRRKLQDDDKHFDTKSQGLFRASFSSFAPTQDNTYSVVSQSNRSRLWWAKYGSQRQIYPSLSDEAGDESNTNLLPEINDDFADYIENYKEESFNIKSNEDDVGTEQEETENLLSEVSELLQTLSSYQYIRELDQIRTDGTSAKLASGEFDTYELLKSQLKILVESLPPFAVSKLDGSQLKALNISTNIVINAPDFAGTSQADEYSLRRHRASQAQSSAFGRSASTPQGSGRTYTANAGYNNPVRQFNTSMSGVSNSGGYSQRAAPQSYNTPRPSVAATAAYSQTPYSRPPGYQPATIQEYQRSLQNGYNPSLTPQQPTFSQRTPQSGYQSHQSQYVARTSSPQKPLTNGQTTAYSTRHYTPQSFSQGNRPATIQQHQAMQQMKAYQEAQRQASGTPQPGVEVNGRTATPNSDAQGQ